MLTNWLPDVTEIGPMADPAVGCEADVTVFSAHADVTGETCMEPAVPSVLTYKTRLTFEIEVTLIPGGKVERLNLMKARVAPAPAVAPT